VKFGSGTKAWKRGGYRRGALTLWLRSRISSFTLHALCFTLSIFQSVRFMWHHLIVSYERLLKGLPVLVVFQTLEIKKETCQFSSCFNIANELTSVVPKISHEIYMVWLLMNIWLLVLWICQKYNLAVCYISIELCLGSLWT
jgi:hypothetical protein